MLVEWALKRMIACKFWLRLAIEAMRDSYFTPGRNLK